LVATGGFEPPT